MVKNIELKFFNMNNLRIEQRRLLPQTLRRETPSNALDKLKRSTALQDEQKPKFTTSPKISSLSELKEFKKEFEIAWSKSEPFNPTAKSSLSSTLEEISFVQTASGDALRTLTKPLIDQLFTHPSAQKYIASISKQIKIAIMNRGELESYFKSLGLFTETEIQKASEQFELSTAVNIVIEGVPHIIFHASNFPNSTNNKRGIVDNELRELDLKGKLSAILGEKQANLLMGSTALEEFTLAWDQEVYPELVNRTASVNPDFSSMTQEEQFAQVKAYTQAMPPDELATLVNKAIFKTRQLTGENYTNFGKNNLLPDDTILLDFLEQDILDTVGKNLTLRIQKDPSRTSDNTEPRGPYFSGIRATGDLGEGQTAGAVITGGNENPVLGTSGNDSITGGEVINGLKGDDNINGGVETKVIFGGQGNDNINGNGEVFGNKGSDSLTGGAGNDILSGGEGNDFLYGGGGNDSLRGDEGQDATAYNKGDDPLTLHGDIEAIYVAEFDVTSASRRNSHLGTDYEGVYLGDTLIANILAGSPLTITTVGSNVQSIKL